MVEEQFNIQNLTKNIQSNDMAKELIESGLQASKEELLEQKKHIEQDASINMFEKKIKMLRINIKGSLLLGKDRDEQSKQQQEDQGKQEKSNTKQQSDKETISQEEKIKRSPETKTIIDALEEVGISNQYVQKAILGTIAKESGFSSQQEEISYTKTSNKKIRELFGSRVSGLSEDELTKLKNDEDAFWDRVYGPDDPTGMAQKYGNTQKGDGKKYRGRGFNGLTFKANYKKYGERIGVDLEKNPDLLKDPDIAAKVNANYFLDGLKNKKTIDMYKNTGGVNDFKDFESALQAVIHINAGLGKDNESIVMKNDYNKAYTAAENIQIDKA